MLKTKNSKYSIKRSINMIKYIEQHMCQMILATAMTSDDKGTVDGSRRSLKPWCSNNIEKGSSAEMA